MQMQLGLNIQKLTEDARVESARAKKAHEDNKHREEEQARLRAENKAIFEKSFMQGATSVYWHKSVYYFAGDIEHNCSGELPLNELCGFLIHRRQPVGVLHRHPKALSSVVPTV